MLPDLERHALPGECGKQLVAFMKLLMKKLEKNEKLLVTIVETVESTVGREFKRENHHGAGSIQLKANGSVFVYIFS